MINIGKKKQYKKPIFVLFYFIIFFIIIFIGLTDTTMTTWNPIFEWQNSVVYYVKQ